ncbi:MAG: type II toxin-antitoxin system VapC family toxin [Candidatus Thorarchaeota archaeon]
MIFLDTTVLVDLLRQEAAAKTWLQRARDTPLYTSEINVFEIYIGLFVASRRRKKKTVTQRQADVEQLLVRLEVLPFDRRAAIESARIEAALVDAGKLIGARDVMVAGTALANGITTVLTRNVHHFQVVPGISVQTY